MTIKMNNASSVNDSNNGPSSFPQAPQLDLRIYSSVITSSIKILTISTGVVGITANLLALIVFLRHKPLLKRPANYFLVSQCTINLLVSLILILISTVDQTHWSPSALVPMCYLWNSRIVFTSLYTSSIYNIVVLTIERYIEIVHPIKHRLKVSRGKVMASNVAGVLICFISKLCLVYPSVKIIRGVCTVGNYETLAIMRFVGVAQFLLDYVIPIAVFTFCYSSMARVLRRMSKVTQPTSDAEQQTDPKIARARRNIIKTLFIVVLGFVVFATFKQFYVLVSFFRDGTLDIGGLPFNAAVVLSYVNCCSDPFIYGVCYQEFRVGLRKLFCRLQTMPSGASTTNAETRTTKY